MQIPRSLSIAPLAALLATGCEKAVIAPGIECPEEGRLALELNIFGEDGDILESPAMMIQELDCHVSDSGERFAGLSDEGELTGDQMREDVRMYAESIKGNVSLMEREGLGEPVGSLPVWVFNCEASDELNIDFPYEDPTHTCTLIMELDLGIANEQGIAYSAEFDRMEPMNGDRLGFIPKNMDSRKDIVHYLGDTDEVFGGSDFPSVDVYRGQFEDWLNAYGRQ